MLGHWWTAGRVLDCSRSRALFGSDGSLRVTTGLLQFRYSVPDSSCTVIKGTPIRCQHSPTRDFLVVARIIYEPIAGFGCRPSGFKTQLWLSASVFVSSHTPSTFSCRAYDASRAHAANRHRTVAVGPAGGLDS